MKYASEAFNLAIAALIAALLLIAPAVAGECSPDKSQITVGLAAGHPYGGPQAVTFCRDEKAAITRYRINQVAGFAGCEVVEFMHFRLECGGERIGHEDAGVRLGNEFAHAQIVRELRAQIGQGGGSLHQEPRSNKKGADRFVPSTPHTCSK